MPAKDTSRIKERMISIFRTRGPSLPVHIASEIGLSILFTSAFLSELMAEKELKTSNMRVGSSPIYLIPGQEPLIERYSQHLKSKEKEAFARLKEKRFLEDAKQEPAIRVALRVIKDFAIPFKRGEEIIWRYCTVPESEFVQRKEEVIREIKPQEKTIEETPVQKEEIPKENSTPTIDTPTNNPEPQEIKPQTNELNIFDEKTKKVEKPEPTSHKEPTKKKKIAKRKSQGGKQNEKFFNKVKEFLSKESIEILDIVGFSKTDVSFKVRKEGEEQFLMAYNKKRIDEKDIIKTSQKASELNLPYTILSMGEPLKKLNNLIEALKNLEDIQKIEEPKE